MVRSTPRRGGIWDLARSAIPQLVSSKQAAGSPGTSPGGTRPRAPTLASSGRKTARSLSEVVRAARKAANELEFKNSEAGKALSLCEVYKKGNPTPGNGDLTPRKAAQSSYEAEVM